MWHGGCYIRAKYCYRHLPAVIRRCGAFGLFTHVTGMQAAVRGASGDRYGLPVAFGDRHSTMWTTVVTRGHLHKYAMSM